MKISTRKLLDNVFSAAGGFSIFLMALTLISILSPIFFRGIQAFVFKATIEHRRMIYEQFGRGDEQALKNEIEQSRSISKPIYEMISRFEKEIEDGDSTNRRKYKKPLKDLKDAVKALIGPSPDEPREILPRNQYGQTRWDRALVKLNKVMYLEEWDYSDTTAMGKKVLVPRVKQFEGTSLADLFPYIEKNFEYILIPKLSLYGGFLTDKSVDSHFFGGIWPEVLGTFYLTIGAMLFAFPFGIVSAIYLAEYSREGKIVSILRICISTLAGVPSIVFGLFGLAFFINQIGIPKSVLAGSLTLALLILPTIIRAAEEAIKAVPHTYKEAALSLGAGRWHTVMSVILPSALPGILTGVVISMGRAAGETAPIIFTAAVSVGAAPAITGLFNQQTPALPWNIYNICTEHSAVDEIRHVQYGMVMLLVLIVLLLNLVAIILRARVARKLKG